MTTFTFVGDPANATVNWTETSVWQGGVVPDFASDEVVIPAIRHGTVPYVSTINTDTIAAIAIGQLFIAGNSLQIGAVSTFNFSVFGAAEISTGAEIVVNAAAFLQTEALYVESAGVLDLFTHNASQTAPQVQATTVQNSGTIAGEGLIDASTSVVNEANGVIQGPTFAGGTLSITAPTFENLGEIFVQQGTLNIVTETGGLENVSGGVLSGGDYFVGDVSQASAASRPVADLYLSSDSAITTDSTRIALGANSDLFSFDNTKSKYEPIESTLTTIGSAGSLLLVDDSNTWNALTVNGTLELDAGTLASSKLTIAPGGALQGFGTIACSVVDNGTVYGGLSPNEVGQLETAGAVTGLTLDLVDSVSGTGTAVIQAAPEVGGVVIPWTLEFGSAASVNVSFASNAGELVLVQPRLFTGRIAPTGGGDQIELQNVPTGAVTGYSYVGNGAQGTLTVDFSGGGPISLKFTGDYDAQSFNVAAGPGPQTLMITVAHAATPHEDFLGDTLSDVLLENAQGAVDVGEVSGGALTMTQVDTLGSQWSFVGSGDYLGDGVDGFLIENTAGNVGLAMVSGGAVTLTDILNGLPATSNIVETGNFLGDGKTQFLIETAAGQVDIAEVVAGVATPTQIDTLGSQWSFVGAGDFLGVGRDQFLIENTLGSVGLASVAGGKVTLDTIATGLSGWTFVGTGDFLGDGKSDFLLDNKTTGQVEVGEVVSGAAVLTVVDTLGSQWSFVGTGDYLGDGRDQVLIENAAGSVGIGEVSGGALHFSTIATGLSAWAFH